MKMLGICSICGRPANYTCSMCGGFICPNCYDFSTGVCIKCKGKMFRKKDYLR
ncbi:MAG: hypothetical protein L6265_03330 [Thermoplasmatales archaeon]|nr:hypothetical protein [Thermoplasmatales archaeon]